MIVADDISRFKRGEKEVCVSFAMEWSGETRNGGWNDEQVDDGGVGLDVCGRHGRGGHGGEHRFSRGPFGGERDVHARADIPIFERGNAGDDFREFSGADHGPGFDDVYDEADIRGRSHAVPAVRCNRRGCEGRGGIFLYQSWELGGADRDKSRLLTSASNMKDANKGRNKVNMTKCVVLAMGMAIVWGLSQPVIAGDIESPGFPSEGSGMYTLEQVYGYLNSGTIAPTPGPFQNPSAGPGPTMKTLKQIYEDIKGKFDQCGATASDVMAGKKFFCTQSGSWGVQTGTWVYKTWYETYGPSGTNQVSSNFQGTIAAAIWSTQPGCAAGATKTMADYVTWANNLVWLGKDDWTVAPAQAWPQDMGFCTWYSGCDANDPEWTRILDGSNYWTHNPGTCATGAPASTGSLMHVRAYRNLP